MRYTYWPMLLPSRAFSVVAAAQQPPAPPRPDAQSPAVTFKVEVNYVEIDAIVTDAQGNFVRNLTKDDFQVTEDGKPQTLTDFLAGRHPDRACRSAALREERDRARRRHQPHSRSRGACSSWSSTICNTRSQRTARTRAAARQFVERYVGANDMVAVVNTVRLRPRRCRTSPSNRELALNAIDDVDGQQGRLVDVGGAEGLLHEPRHAGRRDSNVNADFNELELRYNNARNTLRTLKNLADYMAGMRGRRKAVVWFSEGINYNIDNPINNRTRPTCSTRSKDVVAAATRANVSIYSVDPRGAHHRHGRRDRDRRLPGRQLDQPTAAAGRDADRSRTACASVADETGGFAVAQPERLPQRASRESSRTTAATTCSATTRPTTSATAGSATSRSRCYQAGPDRARPQRLRRAEAGEERRPAKGAPNASARRPSCTTRSTARSRSAADDEPPSPRRSRAPAPNDAIAWRSKSTARDCKFKQTPEGLFANDLEITLFAVRKRQGQDQGRRPRRHQRSKLRPQTYEVVSKGTFRIVRRIQVPPGKYQLRIGAREADSGRLGTVLYDLDAPDFSKGPLSMSGIAITSAGGEPHSDRQPRSEGERVQGRAAGAADRDARVRPQRHAGHLRRDLRQHRPRRRTASGSPRRCWRTTARRCSRRRTSGAARSCRGRRAATATRRRFRCPGSPPAATCCASRRKSMLGKSEPVTREVEFRVR